MWVWALSLVIYTLHQKVTKVQNVYWSSQLPKEELFTVDVGTWSTSGPTGCSSRWNQRKLMVPNGPPPTTSKCRVPGPVLISQVRAKWYLKCFLSIFRYLLFPLCYIPGYGIFYSLSNWMSDTIEIGERNIFTHFFFQLLSRPSSALISLVFHSGPGGHLGHICAGGLPIVLFSFLPRGCSGVRTPDLLTTKRTLYRQTTHIKTATRIYLHYTFYVDCVFCKGSGVGI